ncbi:hypothetical protein K440DRAFT_643823 [Wilcoxina mikolae CBS 423.85]|nr:hypothetical protein K440DRAFT_643823 [Wilcoxina mikolae CBS 423.85]
MQQSPIAGGDPRESSVHHSNPPAQQNNPSTATTIDNLIGNIIRELGEEGGTDLAALIDLTEGDFTSLGWKILARLPGFLWQYEAMSRAVGESDSSAGAALAKILLKSGPLADALRKQILLTNGDVPMAMEESQGTTVPPANPDEREQAQLLEVDSKSQNIAANETEAQEEPSEITPQTERKETPPRRNTWFSADSPVSK